MVALEALSSDLRIATYCRYALDEYQTAQNVKSGNLFTYDVA